MQDIEEGMSVIEELESYIEDCMEINDNFDPYKIAEYLYVNNFRKINKPGHVIVKGEVYVITPELEEKVFKLLNQ